MKTLLSILLIVVLIVAATLLDAYRLDAGIGSSRWRSPPSLAWLERWRPAAGALFFLCPAGEVMTAGRIFRWTMAQVAWASCPCV